MTEIDRLFTALANQTCKAAENLARGATPAEYQGGLRVLIAALEMDWRASVRKAASKPVPVSGKPGVFVAQASSSIFAAPKPEQES